MRTPSISPSTNVKALAVFYALAELPRDFKRVLRVQFKEFIHHLDDVGAEAETRVSRKQLLAS